MNRYRAATTADLDAIVPMMRTYYAEDGYSFDDVDARATLAALLADPRAGQLFVADINGVVAGYLAVTLGYSLEYGGRDAFIDEVFVDERFRRRGLGSEAVDLALSWCRDNGVKALHLEVESHRPAARRLYEQKGFELHDRALMSCLL